jgi:hypothetical protein
VGKQRKTNFPNGNEDNVVRRQISLPLALAEAETK